MATYEQESNENLNQRPQPLELEKIPEAVRAVPADRDKISQYRNIRISALTSHLCISNSALLQNPLKGFFPGTVGREVGSAMHFSKKSPGSADVAIWRAHFENIWANSAEPLGRVTAPNFHGVFDVCSRGHLKVWVSGRLHRGLCSGLCCGVLLL